MDWDCFAALWVDSSRFKQVGKMCEVSGRVESQCRRSRGELADGGGDVCEVEKSSIADWESRRTIGTDR